MCRSDDEPPLYGRIAAGTPIEALRDETNTIEVPHGLFGTGEHTHSEGDSMLSGASTTVITLSFNVVRMRKTEQSSLHWWIVRRVT